MLKGSRVFVTGSRGFVGSHLCRALESHGAEVVHGDLTDGIDITDPKTLEGVQDIDLVYHLAAQAFVPKAWEEPGLTYRVNVGGTINVLEAASRADSKPTDEEMRSMIYAMSMEPIFRGRQALIQQ